jgi:drug/metabolite transporter (DMT)-like permease
MPSRLIGALAALGAALIWGLTFVPSKVAMAEMGPFTLAVLRFSIALLVMLPVASLSRGSPGSYRLPWRTLALLGFTGITLYFGFQNLSLARTSASDAGLIAGSVPAITAAFSALVLKERIGRLRLLGILISILGVAGVALAGSSGSPGTLAGDLLMVGAAISWAIYTMLVKQSGNRMPAFTLLLFTTAFGTLFLLPGGVAEVATTGLGPLSTQGWLSVLFLGLFGSGGSFLLWNSALRHLDASEASTYVNLVPVITVISAALLLGEQPAPAQLAGGALVILGVYLASR